MNSTGILVVESEDRLVLMSSIFGRHVQNPAGKFRCELTRSGQNPVVVALGCLNLCINIRHC